MTFSEPFALSSILKESKSVGFCGTKIVCTIGEKARDPEILEDMLRAGMTVARFDFSHTLDLQYHAETYANLDKAIHSANKMCATMVDTKGMEINIRLSTKDNIDIKAGSHVTLTTNASIKPSPTILPVTNEQLCEVVKAKDDLMCGPYLFRGAEYSLAMQVLEVGKGEVSCLALNDYSLNGNVVYHIQLPFTIEPPALTKQDKEMLVEWVKLGLPFDFMCLSMTHKAQDVVAARAFLDSIGCKDTKILPKIESKKGLLNFESILKESDGVILARGSLGLHVPAEKMFTVQKWATFKCNEAGKVCVINRVVDSMVDIPRPTRAEATDVANAVLDGVDAILLGAETLKGNNPVEAVRALSLICKEAEKCYDHTAIYDHMTNNKEFSQIEALASSGVRGAVKTDAKLILVFSASGETAKLVAKYRPPVPIISVVIPTLITDGIKWKFSGDVAVKTSLLVRGILPMRADPNQTVTCVDGVSDHGPVEQDAIDYALREGLLQYGEQIVVLMRVGGSDIIKIIEV